MEVGSQATNFEHRSYGEELALCQRYFSMSFPVTAGASTSVGRIYAVLGADGGSRNKGAFLFYKKTMRATPTFTFYNESGGTGNFTQPDITGLVVGGSINGTNVYGSSTTIAEIYLHYTADAEL